MKIVFSAQALESLAPGEREGMKTEACGCDKKADCDDCGGSGLLYVMPISDDDMAAIRENFSRQGVKLPGTN